MKYAVIKNGVIFNIVEAEPDFAAQMGWITFPDFIGTKAVGIGWKFNGSSWTEPDPVVEPTPLIPDKEELLAQLNALSAQIQALE
jgi:hypothetical protein